MFPSFLASDKNIKNKTGANNCLNILLLFDKQKDKTEALAERLQAIKKIRKIPIHVFVDSIESLKQWDTKQLAGVFLAESVFELTPVINFGINKKILVFSPFEGDVEKGVTTGLFIAEKIVPYINMQTVKGSHLSFKSFFLRVSKRYE
ncbi:MAG: hypothetical protein HQK75_15845 [Candidatus Magnetomorum sp.]|nr:hypothetical protein [Candidatus Magnetomorum sp.]